MLRIGQVESSSTVDGKYTDGNVAGGITATRLRAAAFNAMQEELAHIVESTGVALDVDDTTQVLVALQTIFAGNSDALGALAALTGAANKLPYFTGPKAAALADLTAFAREILAQTDAAGVLSKLGLANAVIGDSVKRIGFSTNDVKKPYFRFPDTDSVILLATQQEVSTALNNKQAADDTLTELSGKNVAELLQYLGLTNAVIGDGTKNAGFSGGDATKPYMRHTQSDSVIFLATTSQLIGIGQTYRVVTDKVLGVTYTNTSKQPWVVSLKVNLPASAEVLIKVDGVMAGGGNAANNAGTSVWAYPSAIIPPGSTYVVTAPGGTLIQWVELK